MAPACCDGSRASVNQILEGKCGSVFAAAAYGGIPDRAGAARPSRSCLRGRDAAETTRRWMSWPWRCALRVTLTCGDVRGERARFDSGRLARWIYPRFGTGCAFHVKQRGELALTSQQNRAPSDFGRRRWGRTERPCGRPLRGMGPSCYSARRGGERRPRRCRIDQAL